MLRALLELLFTVLIVVVARAVLSSLMKGIANASSTAYKNRAGQPLGTHQPPPSTQPGATAGGELHKDPVCGTFVSESTPFHRQMGGQTFYYCSDACREKHALVAR